jgi:chitodextrinase
VLLPSKPLTVVISSSTPASVTLAWPASTDNVGVSGYGVYLNGTLVRSTSSTSYLIPGLSCATAYTFAVDAVDAAGNRSAQATVSGSIAPCPPDTLPPSAPTALVVTSTTQTTVSLAWKASSDNVGVTGYGISNGGVAVSSTSSLGYTVTGLRCGTSYAIAVDAHDAIGNHSAKTLVTASTSACSTSGAANVFVAPGGSDVACVRGDVSRPCASFAQAFVLALGGDTVRVADGSYPGQTLSGAAKGAVVSFVAQDAGRVLVADLTIDVDRVHVSGVISSGAGESRGSLTICDSPAPCHDTVQTDILVDGFHGKNAFMVGSGITIQNSEFGSFSPCLSGNSEDGVRFWGGGGPAITPSNDQFLSNTVHDIDSGSQNTCQGTSHAGYHVDCMQNQGGSNIEIRNNVFYNCPTSDIQMAPFGSGNLLNNVTLSGNYFGQTQCCNSVVLGLASSAVQCSTLHVTGNVLFKPVNQNGCSGDDISGNTLCSTVSQSGCAVPPAPLAARTLAARSARPPTKTTG